MKHQMHQSNDHNTVEITLTELMNYLVKKCQDKVSMLPFSFGDCCYLCHVAEQMVSHRCEFFDGGSFSEQLSGMFSDEVLDKTRFKYQWNEFGIEGCISQENMLQFYKRGCEIYGKPIPPQLDISCYNSYAYNNVSIATANVTSFHRTMAKIGMLDMLIKNNPDGYFKIANLGN